MRDNQPSPIFATPPMEYNSVDFLRIIRTMETHLASIQEVGPLRISTLNISNLPTAATGLRVGDVWNDSGTLKIVTAP